MNVNGGYDKGYECCDCFWGREPGSLVQQMCEIQPIVGNPKILDAGCGEGKNAIFLARQGASVMAVDTSELAIRNAKKAWLDWELVEWEVRDVRSLKFEPREFDVVIAYGLLHCLPNEAEIEDVVTHLKNATRIGGLHLVCAFNSRKQNLIAHPELNPTLIPHATYLSEYRDWKILFESDEDLHEVHPHNEIPHSHSMTRIIAEKVSD